MSAVSTAQCRILDRNLALEGHLRGDGWIHLDDVLLPTLVEDVARWASSSVATLEIVTPSREPVTALLVSGATLRRDAEVRITYAANDACTVLVPGAPPPEWRRILQRAWRRDSLGWSHKGWWMGRPSARDLAGYPLSIIDLPSRCRPLVTRVEINNKGEEFDLGHLFLAAALVPRWGFAWGREISLDTRSHLDRTAGGGRIAFYKRPARITSFAFERLAEDEAAMFQDLGMRLDAIGPVAVIPEPKKTRHLWRETYVGFLRDTIARRQVNVNLWQATLKIEEMLG